MLYTLILFYTFFFFLGVAAVPLPAGMGNSTQPANITTPANVTGSTGFVNGSSISSTNDTNLNPNFNNGTGTPLSSNSITTTTTAATTTATSNANTNNSTTNSTNTNDKELKSKCNLDRGEVVLNLSKTQSMIKSLSYLGSSDPVIVNATQIAQEGLNAAHDGIITIAGALFAKQPAPISARQQIAAGLSKAATALATIPPVNPDLSITAALGQAKSFLALTASAGEEAIADCP